MKIRKHPASARRARPHVECLESRVVPYSTSGNLWPHPELVTLSIVPDGTILGGGMGGYTYSNLNSAFNARSTLVGRWQAQILKAAQVWAQQTNLNFTLISDNGTTVGGGAYQQGDPGMGDVRFGGYNYGTSTLASAYAPPPVNNFSIAGDVNFNTGQPFNIGYTFDLFTVAAHEVGHALGLNHGMGGSIMSTYYPGLKTALTADDINGIRAIYGGARAPDAYDAAAPNDTFATATNLTSLINPTTLTALAAGLDITTTADADYYTFTAPAGTGGTLTVTAQSAGLSLLSPNLTVYAADQSTVLGSQSGLNQYGATLTVTVSSVTAGQIFYVKVSGADTTAFSTGRYALTLNFGSGSSPTVTPPNTQTGNGNPLSAGGGIPQVTGHDDDHDHHDDGAATALDPATAAALSVQTASFHGVAPTQTAAVVLVGVPASHAVTPVAPAVRLAVPLPESGGGDVADQAVAADAAPAAESVPAPAPAAPAKQPETDTPVSPKMADPLPLKDICFAEPDWMAAPPPRTQAAVVSENAGVAATSGMGAAALVVALAGGNDVSVRGVVSRKRRFPMV